MVSTTNYNNVTINTKEAQIKGAMPCSVVVTPRNKNVVDVQATISNDSLTLTAITRGGKVKIGYGASTAKGDVLACLRDQVTKAYIKYKKAV